MTGLKVASVFLLASTLVMNGSLLRATTRKHPSARVLNISKKWRLKLKAGVKFPVGMDLRMRLTGRKKGNVAEIRGKVVIHLGQRNCKLDVLADLGKGGYATDKGRVKMFGLLSVRTVTSDCSLPAGMEKKIKGVKASIDLTLHGSSLCPKGERPPTGACFTPDK